MAEKLESGAEEALESELGIDHNDSMSYSRKSGIRTRIPMIESTSIQKSNQKFSDS
jgi:hypothetical protein